MTGFTRAARLQAAGKITQAFACVPTVAGKRRSTGSAREIRGFAVKFHTEAVNWDRVGNDIPLLFIQDAMSFVDLFGNKQTEGQSLPTL